MSGGGKKKITLSGGDNEGVPPVPIPNTEVKPFSADGTWLETARESRSLPDSISLRCFAAEHISFAGSPQSQRSRLPTGELAPFRLTLPPAGHPPQAAAGGSPGFHISPLRKQRAVLYLPSGRGGVMPAAWRSRLSSCGVSSRQLPSGRSEGRVRGPKESRCRVSTSCLRAANIRLT